MRNLTPMQKKLLKAWFDKNYNGGYKFDMADKMNHKTYEMIEKIHPTEIHWQNVNHYLEELADNYNNRH